jgi:hypothetical protein
MPSLRIGATIGTPTGAAMPGWHAGRSLPPARLPLKPGCPIVYLDGQGPSPGTFYKVLRDPGIEPHGEMYVEEWLPRRRRPTRIDVIGVFRAPPGAQNVQVLVRSVDDIGLIAVRARLLRAVMALLRGGTRVRLWRGRPGHERLRWQRVPPIAAEEFARVVVKSETLPVWVRHPRTGRFMLEERARRRQAAMMAAALRSSASQSVTSARPPDERSEGREHR